MDRGILDILFRQISTLNLSLSLLKSSHNPPKISRIKTINCVNLLPGTNINFWFIFVFLAINIKKQTFKSNWLKQTNLEGRLLTGENGLSLSFCPIGIPPICKRGTHPCPNAYTAHNRTWLVTARKQTQSMERDIWKPAFLGRQKQNENSNLENLC